MRDTNSPRDRSGSCQRERGTEEAASSTVSIPHSSPAATFAVLGTLENDQRGVLSVVFFCLGKKRDTG